LITVLPSSESSKSATMETVKVVISPDQGRSQQQEK